MSTLDFVDWLDCFFYWGRCFFVNLSILMSFWDLCIFLVYFGVVYNICLYL